MNKNTWVGNIKILAFVRFFPFSKSYIFTVGANKAEISQLYTVKVLLLYWTIIMDNFVPKFSLFFEYW